MTCPTCGYGYRPIVKDGELEGYEQFARPLLRDTVEDRERFYEAFSSETYDLSRTSKEIADAILKVLRGEIEPPPPDESGR